MGTDPYPTYFDLLIPGSNLEEFKTTDRVYCIFLNRIILHYSQSKGYLVDEAFCLNSRSFSFLYFYLCACIYTHGLSIILEFYEQLNLGETTEAQCRYLISGVYIKPVFNMTEIIKLNKNYFHERTEKIFHVVWDKSVIWHPMHNCIMIEIFQILAQQLQLPLNFCPFYPIPAHSCRQKISFKN